MLRFIAVVTTGIIVGVATLSAAMILPVGGDGAKAGPTVLVTVLGGHGSGVILDGGYVLTAAHVARISPDKIMISTDQGKDTVRAEVLWINNEYDVALLKIRDDKFLRGVGSADIDCREMPVGTEVRAEGNPFDVKFVSQWGKVGSLPQPMGHWRVAISIGAPLAPGMSGGPVYGPDGRVVGINVGVAGVGGFYVAVPSSTACMLMGRT